MKKINQSEIISEYGNMGKDVYIGPRALFDPFFIPDHLFDLEKDERNLCGLLSDAIIDNFPASISIYGVQGVGKTVLVNKAIKSLSEENSIFNKNNIDFLPILINCSSKDSHQIVFSMLNSLVITLNSQINLGFELTPEFVLKSDTSQLWNLFKFLNSKTNNIPKIYFLDSVEFSKPKIINKIMTAAISEPFILINSFNVPKCSPYLLDFKKSDFQVQLGSYSSKTLMDITQDRCKHSLRQPVGSEINKFIVDLVCQFDKKVPGSCVRVLRELYPVLNSDANISGSKIREICRGQFEGFSLDELSIAEFISESDIIDRIFLDNICSYFINSGDFYITYEELFVTYKIACESIEYKPKAYEFQKILDRLNGISLLIPSEINSVENFSLNKGIVEKLMVKTRKTSAVAPNYFLTVPPDFLNDMLDVSFGEF